jgi:hypothetical protein
MPTFANQESKGSKLHKLFYITYSYTVFCICYKTSLQLVFALLRVNLSAGPVASMLQYVSQKMTIGIVPYKSCQTKSIQLRITKLRQILLQT